MAPEQEQWLVANIQALNTIVRALAAGNEDNPVFLAVLKGMYELRDSRFTYSQMSDQEIERYHSAVKDLVNPKIRATLES